MRIDRRRSPSGAAVETLERTEEDRSDPWRPQDGSKAGKGPPTETPTVRNVPVLTGARATVRVARRSTVPESSTFSATIDSVTVGARLSSKGHAKPSTCATD